MGYEKEWAKLDAIYKENGQMSVTGSATRAKGMGYSFWLRLELEPGASSINQAILDAMAKEDADICRFIAETAEIGDWHHPQEVIQLPTV